MGTRGLFGFYKNGVTKASYNHYDSYPEELGVKIMKFIEETPVTELNQIFDKIIMVNGGSKPTAEQINQCIQYYCPDVSTGKVDDWYALLRESQGELNAYKEGLPFMIDSADFIKDSLFCEWAYLINLDTNTFEVYRGFQKEMQANRYYDESLKNETYKNCKLIAEYKLESVHSDELVEELLIKGGRD
jgi:hypothetical protein